MSLSRPAYSPSVREGEGGNWFSITEEEGLIRREEGSSSIGLITHSIRITSAGREEIPEGA